MLFCVAFNGNGVRELYYYYGFLTSMKNNFVVFAMIFVCIFCWFWFLYRSRLNCCVTKEFVIEWGGGLLLLGSQLCINLLHWTLSLNGSNFLLWRARLKVITIINPNNDDLMRLVHRPSLYIRGIWTIAQFILWPKIDFNVVIVH